MSSNSYNARPYAISVVIPVCNVQAYISTCLDSVLKQTLSDIEVICVDDKSPDDSARIIKQYSLEDDRVKLLHHAERKFAGGARNTGIKSASGEYIFFLDADDFLPVDALQTLYDAIREQESHGIRVACGRFQLYDGARENKFTEAKTSWKLDGADHAVIDMNEMPFLGMVWNKLYHHSIFTDHDLYFSDCLHFEDVEFSWKLFAACRKAYMLNKVVYFYRQDNSNSYTKNEKIYDNYENFAELMEKIFLYMAEKDFAPRYRKNFGHIYYWIRRRLPKKKSALFKQNMRVLFAKFGFRPPFSWRHFFFRLRQTMKGLCKGK